jgi:hypothetical protein
MPEMTAGRRGSGGHRPAPVDADVRLPWDDAPPIPFPDQARYGTATTDPLGREGPGWHIGDNRLPTLDKGWKRGKDGRAVRVQSKGDRGDA